jgi:hypothetical protein
MEVNGKRLKPQLKLRVVEALPGFEALVMRVSGE